MSDRIQVALAGQPNTGKSTLQITRVDGAWAVFMERYPTPRSLAEEDSSLSLDSEDVKQALNMLEYWTDHWLQEYQGKP